MRKLLLSVMMVLLFFSFSTSALASVTQHEEGLKIIDMANAEIEAKIDESVKNADTLHAAYLAKIQRISKEEKSPDAKQKVEAFIAAASDDSGITNEYLLAAAQELDNELKGKAQKYAAVTNEYIAQLEAIIQDCLEVTGAISQQAIAEAKEYGIKAECSWVYIKFGHKYAWIDPLQIVGYW